MVWVLWFGVFFLLFFRPLLHFVGPLEYSEWNILSKWQLLLLKCLRIQACGIWSQSFFLYYSSCPIWSATQQQMFSILPWDPNLFLFKVFPGNTKPEVYNKVIKESVCRGRRKTITHYYNEWKEIQSPICLCKFFNLNIRVSFVYFLSVLLCVVLRIFCLIATICCRVMGPVWRCLFCSVVLGFRVQAVFRTHCSLSGSQQAV